MKPEWATVKALEKFKWLQTRVYHKDWSGAKEAMESIEEYLAQIKEVIDKEAPPPEPEDD